MSSTALNTGAFALLVYINDVPDNLESLAKLFADDTSLLLRL